MDGPPVRYCRCVHAPCGGGGVGGALPDPHLTTQSGGGARERSPPILWALGAKGGGEPSRPPPPLAAPCWRGGCSQPLCYHGGYRTGRGGGGAGRDWWGGASAQRPARHPEEQPPDTGAPRLDHSVATARTFPLHRPSSWSPAVATMGRGGWEDRAVWWGVPPAEAAQPFGHRRLGHHRRPRRPAAVAACAPRLYPRNRVGEATRGGRAAALLPLARRRRRAPVAGVGGCRSAGLTPWLGKERQSRCPAAGGRGRGVAGGEVTLEGRGPEGWGGGGGEGGNWQGGRRREGGRGWR